MFDIGFFEILTIGIVALLVVGPEKLPGMIRTGVGYYRMFKNSVAQVKEDVERELAIEEIKHDFLQEQDEFSESLGLDELEESLDEFHNEANEMHQSITNATIDYETVSDEEIEQDMLDLMDEATSTLPDMDAQADTGVEVDKKT